MAIKSRMKQKVPRIEIDLSGPQGNVFFLLKAADQLANRLGLDADKIRQRMLRGNYEHAVRVFDAYFGDVVTIYVPEGSDLLS